MRLFTYCLFLSAVIIGFATCQRGNAKDNDKYTVTLNAGKIVVGGKVLSGSAWSLKDLEAVFGKADRTFQGVNTVYVYDKKGLLLYETPEKGIVSEIQVFLSPPTDVDTLTPAKIWPGDVSIEDQPITSEFGSAALSRKWPMYNFKVSYAANVFRGAYMGTYVFAIFSKDFRRLEVLSFGND